MVMGVDSLSTDLFRYNTVYDDKNAKVIFQHAVSTYSFYKKYWEKGIYECDVRLFQDNGEFYADDLDEVMAELDRLKDWALKKMSGWDQKYFIERIEQLQYWLPLECENEGGKFYLF